ncbi:MAG: CoA pyrophosphatase [Longimicrobiales bacterium]|nr:CoA pyrophosphatase [Longimicrobiales bacterium]
MDPLNAPALLRALTGLPRGPHRPTAEGDEAQAAVALILRGPEPVDLLLIKRALSERDPWSGHMALPGGRMDPGDPHLLATALRETREETGVVLEAGASYLGRLPAVAPGGVRLPRIRITPHVFLAGEALHAFPASHEVAAVHWVHLAELCAPDAHGAVDVPLPDGTRSFPCYRVAGEVVWGLTYRILADFLGRVSAPSPPSTPR